MVDTQGHSWDGDECVKCGNYRTSPAAGRRCPETRDAVELGTPFLGPGFSQTDLGDVDSVPVVDYDPGTIATDTVSADAFATDTFTGGTDGGAGGGGAW